MSPPVVRLYQPQDREAVLGLWERCGINRPWLDLGAEIDAMAAFDGSYFLVAGDGDAIDACVMGAYDGRRGWVYHLAVSPERRYEGIGRLLMGELENRMAQRGVVKLNLQVRGDNHEVVEFYSRVGFRDEHLVSMGKRLQSDPASR